MPLTFCNGKHACEKELKEMLDDYCYLNIILTEMSS